MTRPLAIDLFCGLGGWADGLLAEGWDVVGFDIERHPYGDHRYPAQLVIQDVLTLHGAQFRDADLIVASPPCQEYSYMSQPWKLAKAKADAIRADATGKMLADLNRLFDACFRIQLEACEATGRHIPMVVENVRGAQRWVGRARWNYGSFYLWGDVPALMPPINPRVTLKAAFSHQPNGMTIWQAYREREARKIPGFRFDGGGGSFQSASVAEPRKSQGMNWSDRTKRGQDFTRIAGAQALGRKNMPHLPVGHWTNPAENGVKRGGDWLNDTQPSISRLTGSKSPARKAASAMIAKIPFALSRHIAAVFRGERVAA